MEFYNYSTLYIYNIGQYIAVFSFTEECIPITGCCGNTMSLISIGLNGIFGMRMCRPTYRYKICHLFFSNINKWRGESNRPPATLGLRIAKNDLQRQ